MQCSLDTQQQCLIRETGRKMCLSVSFSKTLEVWLVCLLNINIRAENIIF